MRGELEGDPRCTVGMKIHSKMWIATPNLKFLMHTTSFREVGLEILLKQHEKNGVVCKIGRVYMPPIPAHRVMDVDLFSCVVLDIKKVGYSCVAFNLQLFMRCVGYSKRKLLRNPRKSPQSAVSGTPGIKGSAAAQNFLRYLFVKY